MTATGSGRPHAIAGALLAIGLTLVTGACATGTTEATDRDLQVLTSFYPLEFLAEEIGGDHVNVKNLTPSGGEPHELELAPATVRKIDSTDVVVYLEGFQPAIDTAIAETSASTTINIAPFAGLEPYVHDDEGEADGHHDAHDAHDGHDHGPLDPHFWLDPTKLAAVAEHIGDEFAAADPEHAADYLANAETLIAELTDLDADYTAGLATCDNRTVVTSHAAFSYLADRYDLEQLSIAGLDPETEPAPAQLRRVSEQIAARDIDTVFYESSASAKIADVLAHDLNITSVVLDPLETRTDPDSNYLTVMQQNLTALRTALACH